MAQGASKLPRALLESLHAALKPLELRGAMLSAARFIHFGSLVECARRPRRASSTSGLPGCGASASAASCRTRVQEPAECHCGRMSLRRPRCVTHFRYPAALAEVCDARLRPFYAQHAAALSEAPQHDELWGEAADPLLLLNCGAMTLDGEAAPPSSARRAVRRGATACVEMSEGCSLRLSAGFHLCVGVPPLDLSGWPLPEGVCLDGRSLGEERALLVYSSRDSFKRADALTSVLFCGEPIEAWLLARGLEPALLWSEAELQAEREGRGIELWSARLFCSLPCTLVPSAEAAELVAGYYAAPPEGWSDRFRSAARLSLAEVNARTSPAARDAERQQLRRRAGAS